MSTDVVARAKELKRKEEDKKKKEKASKQANKRTGQVCSIGGLKCNFHRA